MNPYSSDQTDSLSATEERSDLKPGLSAGTIIATIFMLLFGFYGLIGILGLVGNVFMLANANNSIQVAPQTTANGSQTPGDEASPSDGSSDSETQPTAPGGPNNTIVMPPSFQPSFANTVSTIGLGLLDFILAIPMVLWSIQVLQRKRSAAVKLSWLALGMALLTILRAGLTYLFLPEVMEQAKKGMLAAQQQQSTGGQNPPPVDLDTIMQVMTTVGMGCIGIIFLFNFLVYLFTFFQLRKPTTLQRLENGSSKRPL